MNNDFATYSVERLEIRRRGGGGRSLSGRFGYSQGPGRRMATLRNRGMRRKERIQKKAFNFSLREFKRLKDDLDKMLKQGAAQAEIEAAQEELSRRNVHVLAGHDFNKPLGSLATGATIIETDDAIEFNVDLPEDENQWPSYMVDTVKQVEAGLIGGISPGFIVPPRDVVPDAETEEPEPGNEAVTVRVIKHAVLFELSLVTRPSYSETSVDVREEDFKQEEKQEEKQVRLWL